MICAQGIFDYDSAPDKLVIRTFHDKRLVMEQVNAAVSRIYLERTDNPGIALPVHSAWIRVISPEEQLVPHNHSFFVAYHSNCQVYIEDECVFRLFRKCVQRYEVY
jgi:hypothetical protein